ncbi:uncharacterized protein ISCGN_028839 [Ixodes scapularis]
MASKPILYSFHLSSCAWRVRIALTSCVGKLLERIILCRLVHHLETVGALPECYAGFRRGRCTADAIADLVTALEDGKARHQTTGVVLLDISKAFDAVEHNSIVTELKRLGIGGRMLAFIRAFLEGREAQVSAAGVCSTVKTVALAALPQAARIAERTIRPVLMAVYADDIAIWAADRGCCRKSVQKELQRALDNIYHFLTTLGFSLSAAKSVALLNAPHRTYKFTLSLQIAGAPVPIVKQATYLGLKLDDRVSWQPAVSTVLNNNKETTSILRILGGVRRGTSQRMMLQLYHGLIKARTLYALPLLDLNHRQWASLERAQRVALRICLRLVAAISLKLGCNVELLDKCGADLVIFGTGPKVPENTKDLLAQCEVEFAAGVCARQFANRCLPPLPRGMVVVILEGISQEVSSKCNVTNPLHNEFLKYASCMNKVGDALHKCMKKLTLSLDYSASIEPHLRVGRSCCNFAEYLTCSGDAMKKECGEEAEEYLKKLLTRSAGDFIEIACINHRTDFESCKSSANVVDMSTTRITSLLSPMAKLVSAEG